MAKAYKTGNSVQFTATLNASYNADKITTSTDEKVFDVAAAVVDDLAAAEKESS